MQLPGIPTIIATVFYVICMFAAFIVFIIEAIRHVAASDVKHINGEPAFTFEGEMIQLLNIKSVLFGDSTECTDSDEFDVIISSVSNRPVGFIVDKLLREEDLVVKTLDVISEVRQVSGASLLGDGSIVLILDTNEMVKMASLKKAV